MLETIAYVPSSRLRIDRAAFECERRSGGRAAVLRRSGPLETAASEFLDGLTRTVGSVFFMLSNAAHGE